MDAKHLVRITEKMLALVEELMQKGPCGVTELADDLDMGKSAVHNHLTTFQEHGYVLKDGNDYRVRLKLLEVGGHSRKSMEVYQVVEPEVKSLTADTGELANLLVEKQGTGVYLMRAKGDDAVDLDTCAGLRTSLHTMALGKVILANLPGSRVGEIIEHHGLEQKTPKSTGAQQELFQVLEGVRERGYVIDDGERLEGLRYLVAPIKSSSGGVFGTISISAPASRVSDEDLRGALPERVLSATNVVELNINYRHPSFAVLEQ